MGRHRITVGTEEDGRLLEIAISGRNILIVGDLQSGKSWVAGLGCEQTLP
jgi:hypothetical protein